MFKGPHYKNIVSRVWQVAKTVLVWSFVEYGVEEIYSMKIYEPI